RLEGRRLLELEGLAAQQLVLPDQLGGGLANLVLELFGRPLELRVESLALTRLGQVVQDGDDADQLALLGEDLAGDRLGRERFARLRLHAADPPRVPRRLAGEEHAGV